MGRRVMQRPFYVLCPFAIQCKASSRKPYIILLETFLGNLWREFSLGLLILKLMLFNYQSLYNPFLG